MLTKPKHVLIQAVLPLKDLSMLKMGSLLVGMEEKERAVEEGEIQLHTRA